MADGNINLGIQVNLQDAGASAGLNKLSKEAEAAATKSSTRATQAGRQQLNETAKLAAARSTLGIRSERDIQSEINKTVRSYERLASSGKLSMAELARAHDATKQKITALINESGRLTKEQEKQARGDRRRAIGQKALIGIGGVVAAAATLKAPVMRSISLDRTIAGMSNTANNDLDVPERIAAMKDIENVINNARRIGGSTREEVAEAYKNMLARGVVSEKIVKAILTDVVQSSVAAEADPNDMASVVMAGIDSFKISPERARNILTGGLRAGQLGGFEMNNMGRWLAQQMAVGGLAGMQGEEDLYRLMAYNQLAVKTAGSPDQAGTNIKDFINALSSDHFKQHAISLFLKNGKRVKAGERSQLRQKWDNKILEYQKRGISPDLAIIEMMDKKLQGDNRFVNLQNQLKNLDPKDTAARQKNLEAQAAIIRGSAIGKLFGNQQEMAGFLAVYNNREKVTELVNKIRAAANQDKSNDEITKSHAVIASTADYKVQQAVEDKKLAEKAAMDNLTPAIGAVARGFSSITMAYPGLVGGTITAGTALATFAGAVGSATFALRMLGGGSALGGITTTGGIIGRGKGANILPMAAKGGKIMRAGGTLAIGMTAASLGGMALDSTFGAESGISKYGSAALNGAAVGATIGSLVPVAGTGIGAGVGAIGGLLWQAVSDALKEEKGGLDIPPQKIEIGVNVKATQGSEATVDGINSSGPASTTVRANTGNIMTGAPG